MQSNCESTATLVIYDHDLTLTKCHSEGSPRQRSFETPYSANLRVFLPLQEHLQRLSSSQEPRILLGVATFGEFQDRVLGSWEALGIDPKTVLICAKYIPRYMAYFQGKNEHIALILQQHYERNPHIRITRVVLIDDDSNNIAALKNYSAFIKMRPWNGELRYDVPVVGILAPRPVLIQQPNNEKVHDKIYAEEKIYQETPESEERFLAILRSIEVQVFPSKKNPLTFKFYIHLPQFAADRKSLALNPLTRSLDATGFFEKNEVVRKTTEIGSSSDDEWGSGSTDSLQGWGGQEDHESTNDERVRLYKSS